MTRTLAALAAIAATFTAPIAASCPPAAGRANYAAPAPAYAAPAVNYAAPVAYAPVAVVVPLYSVSYTPAPEPEADDRATKELAEELKKLRAEVEALKARPPVLPQQAPPASPAVQVLKANCARCHGAAAAEKKGGGLALFDAAGEPKLPARAGLKVARKVLTGQMPPGKPLSDPERQLVADWVESKESP